MRRAIGFTPPPVMTLDDLRTLPLLTASDIRERKTDLMSESVPEHARHFDFTGGTTSTHTSFARDDECRVARFGRQWGILQHLGYSPGDRRGLIWGSHADLGDDSAAFRAKRWLRRFASADEAICCTVMSRDDMLAYHRRLRVFRPRVLYGYPNAIEQFATFILGERLDPITVSRVFCTAERLTERQRVLFQRVFDGEVFNLYCSREHGCVAFECSAHRGFHVDTGSVIVEILRDGRPAKSGESGEIVITDLLNTAMPFIRHATGDRGTFSAEACGCGCALPTIHGLDGRISDMLYLPDGRCIAGVMLPDLFMDIPELTHAQFIQQTITSLDVNIVVKPGTSPEIRNRLLPEIRSIVGDEIAISIHFVADIPRNPRSGKYQEVICRIQPSSGAPGALVV